MAVTMQQAIKAVRDYFETEGYKYRYDEDKQIFNTSFNLSKTKLGSVDIHILVRPTSKDPDMCHRFVSYGEVSLKADAESMGAVAEYLHRANYGLSIGNFELDPRDGEIRYKVSANVKDGMIGQDAIDDMIALPVAMYNKYGNGLLAVAMGMMTAEDAAKKADGE